MHKVRIIKQKFVKDVSCAKYSIYYAITFFKDKSRLNMDIILLTVYVHECICAHIKFCQFICEMWSLNIREGLQKPYWNVLYMCD